ncbi:hypothetical protein C5Y96_24915 [Blastopirellula marina]|uniref:DUF3500 domain-containing protein n=1 Tax=Blastopirellula marina TaxID=124 RepID=A0A2S8F0A9_9BACT|nr:MULTISPECIES: DUF3500 domain-containing protein [Pirellulaceae]PQO25577.1 hypothetical protein C5Y96_24915 [Blastopirellula marina]RCS42541.1 DUF3500 domain-containing protein [Bremerella cremea]
MNTSKLILLVSAPTLTLATIFAYSSGTGQEVAAQTVTESQTQAVVDAATAFLESLTGDQRKKTQFEFKPQPSSTAARFARKGGSGGGMRGFIGEKYGEAVWSNFPVDDVPRPGLQLGSLTTKQRAAATKLLETVLSPKGYQKVVDIMGSDQVLHEKGTNYASGNDVYTLAVFGAPSSTDPWMLQFGGHHLALNIVIVGVHGTMTPSLTGTQPAVYKTKDNRRVRVLAEENDKAFELLNSLNEQQRKQAILEYRVGNLILGPGYQGEKIVPEGLNASAMDENQRKKLLDLISEWAGIINDAYANPRLEEIKAGLDETYFAWSGPITCEEGQNGSAYYRIQGPKVIIEYAPQGGGPGGPGMSGPTMHVHTIYRDPTNEYGTLYTLK